MAKKPKSAEGRARSHFAASTKSSKSAKRNERVAVGSLAVAGASLAGGPAVAATVGTGAALVAANATKQAGKDREAAARQRRQGAAAYVASAAKNARTKSYTDSMGRHYANGRAITRKS